MAGGRRERGELEAHVLRTLWYAERPLTAKDIAERIPGATPAHTTVLTALDRLEAKGDVRRASGSLRNILFEPSHTEDEYVSRAMLQRLATSADREAALMKFTGALAESDLDVLRRTLLRADES